MTELTERVSTFWLIIGMDLSHCTYDNGLLQSKAMGR